MKFKIEKEKMSRRAESRKIREISEGNFHSIHASNKAEKFKFSKLTQGIESCRNAQAQQFRKEERELWKTLEKISLEKSKHVSEEEQYFSNYSPGDGIAMISLCDLSNQNDQNESLGNQDADGGKTEANCLLEEKEEDVASKYYENVRKIQDAEKETDCTNSKNNIQASEFELKLPQHRKISAKQEEASNTSLYYTPQGWGSVHNTNHEPPQKGNQRRRFSIESHEITPFYMKKKYERHVDDTNRPWTDAAMQRFLRRRHALTLEDERYMREWQAKAPSADLGTITFRTTSSTDRRWLCADVKKEREKAIKRQSSANMENAYQHRPKSGLRRISMALERMPSDEKLKPTNQTPRSRKSISYSPRQALDSARSLTRGGRKFSLPIDPEASNEKMRLQTQRRHTVGEIFSHDSLFKRKDLPDVKDFKNLKDLDCSNELVCFDDKGVVFPAFQKGREYNMKEYLALRKCRYLRLSKLNWESLQWQSKHQQLLDM